MAICVSVRLAPALARRHAAWPVSAALMRAIEAALGGVAGHDDAVAAAVGE